MSKFHLAVPDVKNTYVEANMLPQNVFEAGYKRFVKDLQSQFPEIKNTELGDRGIHAEYLNEFPTLANNLGKKVVEPLFSVNYTTQAIESPQPTFAGSVQSVIIGPQLTKYLFISPRAPIYKLLERLSSYSGMMTADAILKTDVYLDGQKNVGGFALNRTITRVPQKYGLRTNGLNPILPVGMIRDLEIGRSPVILEAPRKPESADNIDLEEVLARISEEIHAFRIDTDVRLLFK